MADVTIEGMILTPQGWVAGRLHAGAVIERIEPRADARDDRFLLPGFIDLHVHGGGGADCMDGIDAVYQMARFHLQHGTTALLATTLTAPINDIRRAVAAIGKAVAVARPGSARVIGLHLEGPFISPEALGAQPPFALAPDVALLDELCALAPMRVATIAPEIDLDGVMLARLRHHGVKAQIGHTACSYAQALAALQAGAAGFTHLFNAMSGMHHRKAGCVGCALAHATRAEMIFDLHHVEPGSALAALRAIPGLYGVTDAVAAAGMPDGEYHLGRHRIFKQDGVVRLADGSLAGSTLTMDQALRNLLSLGLPLADAAARLSTVPADYLGLTDRGRLIEGGAADIVVVDKAGTLLAVLAEGTAVDRSRALS